ncbi:MAG: EpsG family protein [Bacteroidaceae bacterium]|nr:EpsG family protein [Bacteroidaceae bacterium]
MIAIIYTLLLALTIWILYISGRSMQNPNNSYWKSAIPAISAFTLNEGLRFGRGLDYNYYYHTFQEIAKGNQGDLEPVFYWLGRTVALLEGEWQAYVMLMSFILIISVIYFLENYRENIKYILPLFPLFSLAAENLMRWFLGFSFILIALRNLYDYSQKGKKKINLILFILFSFIGFQTHYGLLVVPVSYYFILKFKKPFFSPWVSISIYILLCLIFDTNVMLSLIPYTEFITNFEVFSGYSNNIDYWVTSGHGGGSASGVYYINMFVISLVYLGYLIYKRTPNDNAYIFAYNLFLFGCISLPITRPIELLYRYNNLFLIFQFIIMGYILRYYYIKHLFKVNAFLKIFFLVSFLNYGRVILFTPFMTNEKQYLYVWDKDGAEYLNVYDVYLRHME